MTDGDWAVGTSVKAIRRARESADPLPGTTGFAGVVDGAPVVDVLGREPLFTEGEEVSTDRSALDDPRPVTPGTWGGQRVWSLPDPNPYPDDRAAVTAIREALAERTPTADAVSFSGGVDSSVVAELVDGPLYVAGYPDAGDVARARSAADRLGRDLTVVELDDESVETAVGRVAAATNLTDPMAVSIAVPLFVVASRAAEDGADSLALGQGADELFGGYEKVATAPNDDRLDATTVRAAARETIGSLPEQLRRDVLAVRSVGIEPVTPLLHDDVVATALRLDGPHLVSPAGERKWAFRRAARTFVPDRLAFRSKTAVQYGSGVSRAIERLAVDNGFERNRAGVEAYVDDRSVTSD